MDKDLIGQKVSYARLDEKGQEHVGEGVVHAVFLSPDRRIQVRVADGDKVINADLAAINLTGAGALRYFEGVRAVRARADEINSQIRTITEAGNKEVEELYARYLGKPLAI